jgi:hypothetical protein
VVTIRLLDIDRLSPADAKALGNIMAAFGCTLALVLLNGSLCIRISEELIDLFLAVVARDVLPVRVA